MSGNNGQQDTNQEVSISSHEAVPSGSSPFRGRQGMALLLCFVFVVAVGLWLALRDTGPKIDPESPAAQLLRDDAAKQAAAQKALEAAKAGVPATKEPRLFLTVVADQKVQDANWIATLGLKMDEDKCSKYYGDSEGCKKQWKLLQLSAESWKPDTAVPGSWSISKDTELYYYSSYTSAHARVTVPLADLPNQSKLTFALAPNGLGKGVEIDAATTELPLPQFSLTPKLSYPFADPDNPRRLLVQGFVSSPLPLDKKSLEQRLHFTIEAKGGQIGTPEIVWKGNTVCNFTLPITQLPNEAGPLVLRLDKGVARVKGSGDNHNIPKGSGISQKEQQVVINLPGSGDFVDVDSIDVSTTVGDDNIARPMLVVDFTAPVKTEAALKAVSAKLLPLYGTAKEEKDGKPTDWSEVVEYPKKARDAAPAVTLTPVPQKTEYTTQVAFQYKAPSGRYMAIEVAPGLPSNIGYSMKAKWSKVEQVPSMPTELRFMQEGNILSLTGARKLALMSRGLETIKWQAWRVRPDYINLLVSKSSEFTDPRISGYSIAMEDISDNLEGTIPLVDTDGLSPQYSSLDLGALMEQGARGIFQLTVKGKRGAFAEKRERDRYDSYDENYDEEITRFVLLTDLGLVVKENFKNERTVFVSSFAKGGPVKGAEVRVIARNGLVLLNKTTDDTGKVELPDLSGFSNEKKAIALDVRYGNDMTYLPLSGYEVRLNPSEYYYGADEHGLNIFTFSERGIFRPGEELRFGLMAKNGDWDPKAASGLPLTAKLIDPRGSEVMKKVVTLSGEGLADVTMPTQETSPTGRYYLEVYLDDRQMDSVGVQVEDFQPDRIKVSSRLYGKEAGPAAQKSKSGWLRPEDLTAEVTVENLYGTPGREYAVRGSYYARKVVEDFLTYKDYTFVSPSMDNAPSEVENTLSEQLTDDDGKTRYTLPVDTLEDATYVVRFKAEGFEPGGGRSVLSRSRVLISPFSQFIGWRSTANLNFLAKDAPAEVEFIALGNEGSPVDSDPLTVKIRAVDHTAVLVKNDSGQYRYEQQRQTRVVDTKPLSISKDGLKFSLPTQETGEHELVLEDAKGITRCLLPFTVAGGANRWQGLKRDATLRVRLDKEKYNAGEDMQVFISAPYAGTGLITLESDRVLASTWFTATTTDSVQHITAPKDLEGRGFLMVHMLRGADSEAINMDPTANAIVPFLANMEKRNLAMDLKTPELVIPGETLTMSLKAKEPGKALVFAVDEGILQLTSFETPSPITSYLKEKSHDVRGAHNWDLLMPEYGLVQRESAFGGDLSKDALSKLNPFRRKAEGSVVYWSGLVDVGPEAKDLTWTVPAYFNGKLRVMAIGTGPNTIGETETGVLVRGPVVITPNLPVAVAPGDSFDVTVALANNLKDSGKAAPVTLNVELDKGLVFETEPPKTLAVDEGREGRTTFRLKATETLGESVVRFSASVGSGETPAGGQTTAEAPHTVCRPISLSVRPAVPRMSAFAAGRLTGKEQVIPVARDMYPQFATVQASLSGLPLPLVDGLSRYLVEYPHGCTEQIISKAFPYALLHGNSELMPLPKGKTAVQAREDAVKAVDAVILTLRSRQIKPGRYALWPQQHSSYTFLTVYSLDFMITAKESGFSVPQKLLDDTIKEVRALLQLPATLNEARLVAYAAWVHTRAEQQGVSNTGDRFRDMSRLIKHCDETLPGWRRDVTAALLAGSYSIMQQNKEAADLIKDVAIAETGGKTPWQGDGWFITPLWANGLYMSMLANHFPDKLASPAARDLLVALINDIGQDRYTTTGAAQAIRGITGYAVAAMKTAHPQNGPALKLEARDSAHAPLPMSAAGTLVKRMDAGNSAAEFAFSGGEGLYWQIFSDGFDRVLAPGPVAQKLSLSTQYIPVNGKSLDELGQGDEVFVLVKAKTLSGRMDNVAITTLLPGGFEMIISQGGEVVGVGSPDSSGSSDGSGDSSANDEDQENNSGNEGSGSDSGNAIIAYPNQALIDDVAALLAKARLSSLSPMSLTYADRREERMVLYTSLDTTERAFIFRIKAVNKGKFSLPASFAEALYDKDARARTGVGVVEVK